ncbi:MAG TPA: hypothetical protein VHZ95_22415, partial [Polyangiales bacterium]|nr:hypothetical protein [Polyangiales bacterium]
AWQIAEERARAVAERHGLSADLSVWLDVPTESTYEEPAGDPSAGLWVSLRHHPMERLGKTSFLLGELCNKKMARPRLIFPAEIRADVLAALEGVIG